MYIYICLLIIYIYYIHIIFIYLYIHVSYIVSLKYGYHVKSDHLNLLELFTTFDTTDERSQTAVKIRPFIPTQRTACWSRYFKPGSLQAAMRGRWNVSISFVPWRATRPQMPWRNILLLEVLLEKHMEEKNRF